MNSLQKSIAAKTTFFLLASIASLLLLGKELFYLLNIIASDDAYTHLAVIPLVSGFFLWSGRKTFQFEKGNFLTGIALITFGAVYILIFNVVNFKDPEVTLALQMVGVFSVIYGAFILCWGQIAFRKLLFPFIFLFLAIPVPHQALNAVIEFLQWGSAVMVGGLYTVLGQAFLRDGTSFHLNTLSITIAPECSGIRSTMALIITGAIAAEMFLKNPLFKTGMLLLIVPLSLLKNAIRIVTITMLAQYVNMSFLTDSFLHHSGGIFFYLIVLAIYFPLLFLLSKIEDNRDSNKKVI